MGSGLTGTVVTPMIFLALAFTATLLLAVIPFLNAESGRCRWLNRLDNRLVWLQFLALAGALAQLLWAMVTLDYSLEYVFNQTSARLPLIYRITGTWSGHEGSLLLWTTVIAAWMPVYTWRTGFASSAQSRITIGIMAMVSLGFQLLLMLSSPFTAVTGAVPVDGRGMNPMLQDIGLALHPPALYIGYGGIVVVFAMVMAALTVRTPLQKLLAELHGMAMAAWGWLTLGIALGSWWAYRELGWGGWWFWDPVENASLMPWLTMTALIHANLLCRRGRRVGITISTLATASLGLMLVGMFIVRSGIMTSVHAFASSPTLGLANLSFIVIATLAGFTLQVVRPPVEPADRCPLTRTDILLMSFIAVLVMACATVLLGTLYPVILDVLDMGRISVGPAYFNTFFVPLTLLSLILLVFSACTGPWLAQLKAGRITSAHIGHLGLIVVVLGALLSAQNTEAIDLRMWVNQRAALGDYEFQFTGTTPRFGPNYLADFGFVDVYQNEQHLFTTHPEKRLFPNFGQVMTEVGHKAGVRRDIYVVLGEPFEDGSWAVRLKVIPFISLLWLGAVLMVVSSTGISLSLPRWCRAHSSDTHTKKI